MERIFFSFHSFQTSNLLGRTKNLHDGAIMAREILYDRILGKLKTNFPHFRSKRLERKENGVSVIRSEHSIFFLTGV